MEKLHWFLAKMVFQITVEGRNNAPQFEEQFRLIKADELTWAVEKAAILGRMDSTIFLNDRNQKVEWKFVEIVEALPLDGIVDGMELYTQTEEPENSATYLAIVKKKAKRLIDKLNRKPTDVSLPFENTIQLQSI
jgi:hypothetical protein